MQLWQLYWLYFHLHLLHLFYVLVLFCCSNTKAQVGFVGGPVFLVINSCLFFRLLVADGLLGEAKRRTAIDRLLLSCSETSQGQAAEELGRGQE